MARNETRERKPQVAVRMGTGGIGYVDALAAKRTKAESVKVTRSDIVRRMMAYAVEHMPESYGSTTPPAPTAAAPTPKGKKP